jgi:signal transduction histidine kinase
MASTPADIDIPRAPKIVSETKRDRDVFRLYGPAFRNIPHLDHTSALGRHVPIAAKDSALVAFAQLAAIRLGAARAIISLIDMKRQHILAEATPVTSLRSGIRSDLWLGNVSLPREVLVCEQVLGIDPQRITASEQASVVFNDLAEHDDYKERNYVKDNIVRFYAGVALTSPRGAIVGALAILDPKPRHGLPRHDVLYLHDLAATIMEHLDTYTLKDQHMRGEQLTRGLISFAEGASALQTYSTEDRQSSLTLQPYISPLAAPAFQPYDAHQHVRPISTADMHIPPSPPRSPTPPPKSTTPTQSPELLHGLPVPPPRSDNSDSGSVRALQESILPANSKAMFARAANIMRASSDLDGVLILDASIAAAAHHDNTTDTSESSAYDSLPSEGEGSHWFPGMTHGPTSQQQQQQPLGSGQRCQILGFSTRDTSSVAENIWALRNRSLLESDLRRMLSLYPMGNIVHFTAEGEAISSTDSESSTSTITPGDESRPASKHRSRRGQTRSNKTLNAIQLTLPGARSVAFVPFWDFERSRWFAGCLCWTNEPDRLLSPQLDLLFFKVFGHSVMNELSRLDTIASDQVKTTFVSLISHELRSPLHGILGSIQFMQDSPLDSFQVTMLNSMAACGQTLLDTIDHILDYSKINETNQNVSSKKLKGTKTVCLSSKPLKTLRASIPTPQHPAVDLGLATEEVVEAVYAGLSFRAIADTLDNDGTLSPYDSRVGDDEEIFPTTPAKRKSCFIILDVEDQDWNFCLPIGAWRRILMNIFGNALKFTNSGHIKVSLRANRSKGVEGFTNITVSIIDTGMGMHPEFLANKVFQPFSQENPHSSGTGLGLSIVRQIIEKIGGKVDVTSVLGKGTHVVVKLALPSPETPQREAPQRSPFLAALSRVRGRKICVLHQLRPVAPDELATYNALEHFSNTLGTTMRNSLHMEVVHTTDWEGHDADLVICPEPSFHYLATIRAQQNAVTRAPVVIFVATDGLEAATLRSDARILNRESMVEIITQP